MKPTDLLAKVKVASPCRARWEDMAGDAKSRFCGQCQKHVYNFSSMTAEEVTDLIRAKEGKLCGRFYRRTDGTMLTANCPVGEERYSRRLKVLAGTAAALLFASFTVMAWSTGDGGTRRKGRFAEKSDEALWTVKGWLGLNPKPVLMGVICVPLPPTPPPATQPPASDRNDSGEKVGNQMEQP